MTDTTLRSLKTLNEFCQDVAIEEGYQTWSGLILENQSAGKFIYKHTSEASKRYGEYMYAEGMKSDKWISVVEGDDSTCPEIGHDVLVQVQYNSLGGLSTETFSGFLGEDGDLYTLPDEYNYGFPFKECVIKWQPLPELPTNTKQ